MKHRSKRKSEFKYVALYSLMKVPGSKLNKAIRVRRDNDNVEADIGFIGKKLDVGGLSRFIGANLVATPLMNVDTDGNGVVDNFTSQTVANTTTYSLDSLANAQKINVTASSGAGRSLILQMGIGILAGQTATLKIDYKLNIGVAGFTGKVRFDWYTAGDVFISSSDVDLTVDTGTGFVTATNTATATATTAKATISFHARTTGAGQTGTVWYKNASMTISNNSAYIVTWYDQSGNGNHATQATASNQPRIINAGVLEKDTKGNSSIRAISANDTLLTALYNATFDISANMTINAVHDPITTGGGSVGRLVSKNDTSDYALYLGGSNVMRMSATTNSTTQAYALATTNISTVVVAGNSIAKFTWQGNDAGTDIAIQATATGNNSLNLFNRASLTRGYDGYVSEVIIFNNAMSDANRLKLESNQIRRYRS